MNRTLFAIFFISSLVFTQKYPSWFFDKTENETSYVCGMVENEYYKDSSFASAKLDAAFRLALNENSSYLLEDIFQSVAGEKAWMDTRKKIMFDTSRVEKIFDSFVVVDSFQTESFTFVAISEKQNSLNGKLIEYSKFNKPNWIENIPKSKNYNYSVGISESYYHETESWENAEENGRIMLAHEFSSNSKQIQKKLDNEYSDIVHEIVNANLKNVQIVRRWLDPSTKLHYVLIKSPK